MDYACASRDGRENPTLLGPQGSAASQPAAMATGEIPTFPQFECEGERDGDVLRSLPTLLVAVGPPSKGSLANMRHSREPNLREESVGVPARMPPQ